MERRLLLEMAKEMGPSEVTRLLCEVVREQAEENYTGLLKERWIRAAQRLEDALHGFGDLREAAAALGRKGGLAKSEAKTIAVRQNGRKGGRPKKTE